MVLRLSTKDADFSAAFADLLASKREASADVDATVRDILDDVRENGDAALLAYTARFDRLEAEGIVHGPMPRYIVLANSPFVGSIIINSLGICFVAQRRSTSP